MTPSSCDSHVGRTWCQVPTVLQYLAKSQCWCSSFEFGLHPSDDNLFGWFADSIHDGDGVSSPRTSEKY